MSLLQVDGQEEYALNGSIFADAIRTSGPGGRAGVLIAAIQGAAIRAQAAAAIRGAKSKPYDSDATT